jgi:hypothetical protein
VATLAKTGKFLDTGASGCTVFRAARGSWWSGSGITSLVESGPPDNNRPRNELAEWVLEGPLASPVARTGVLGGKCAATVVAAVVTCVGVVGVGLKPKQVNSTHKTGYYKNVEAPHFPEGFTTKKVGAPLW